MGRIYDDLEGHEGYGARRLADGTLSTSTPGFRAYVAACACGWTGGEHPPTEHGYEAAVDEWDEHHARPLLAEAVPPAVREAIREVQRAVSALLGERPAAGLKALHGIATWAEASVAGVAPSRRAVSQEAPRKAPGRARRL